MSDIEMEKIWGPVEEMPLRSVSPQHKGTFSPTISNSRAAFLPHLAPIKHSRLDYVTFIRMPAQTNPGKLIRTLGVSWKGFDCGSWCALHQWPPHSCGTFVMPIVLRPVLSFSTWNWRWTYSTSHHDSPMVKGSSATVWQSCSTMLYFIRENPLQQAERCYWQAKKMFKVISVDPIMSESTPICIKHLSWKRPVFFEMTLLSLWRDCHKHITSPITTFTCHYSSRRVSFYITALKHLYVLIIITHVNATGLLEAHILYVLRYKYILRCYTVYASEEPDLTNTGLIV